MKIVVLLILATLAAPKLPAESSQSEPQDVTTRIIMTNDPGFDPLALTYAISSIRQKAIALHQAVLDASSKESRAVPPAAAPAMLPPSPDSAASESGTESSQSLPVALPKTVIPE